MSKTARFQSAVPRARPAGSRVIEAYSLKLGRRLQCFGEAVFEQWIRLEVDPTIQTFCERPLDLNFVDGVLRVDFWVRQGDREMLLIMDNVCEAEIPVPQLSRRRASNRRQQMLPVYGDTLEIACRTCGAKAAYRLNVALLDAPYRCGSCGHLYGASPPASLPHKRPFNKKARIAITRLRSSYFAYF